MQREILAAYDTLATTQPVTRETLRTTLAQTHPTGASFEAAFSRALHGLCLRGALVAIIRDEPSYPFRGEHIEAVRRAHQYESDGTIYGRLRYKLTLNEAG